MILMIDNYDSFTYNLVQLLAESGADVRVVRNDEVTAEEALAMEPAGIVISPGPGTPDDAGISRDVVTLAAEAGIPLLGVCLGHQCIAEVFGGRIVRGTEPVHGKTAEVRHSGDGLLDGVPDGFNATRYHSLTVDPDSVPQTLQVTASTDDGIIMALQHSGLPIHGVQFHPESVLTPEGIRILENFLEVCGPGSGPLTITGAIARVVEGESLSEAEAQSVMGEIMDGETTPSQIASLLTALRMKGETTEEITGFARAMRARVTPVSPKIGGYVDTCGTGGDGQGSFNVSTVAAFVVAGAGVPVAKHGNRSVSSACGSADVLEALGVRIDLSAAEMARCIDDAGVGFLFAQALHPSMKYAAVPRRETALRTVFNLLGPLTNPAGAKRQVLGVFDRDRAVQIAEVAGRLGAERVLVVHGEPGMDEVSPAGETFVADFSDGEVTTYRTTPEELGFESVPISAVRGGDAEKNALIATAILQGEAGPHRDTVLMNAAAALLAAGAVEDLQAGVRAAAESIDSGAAAGVLGRLREITSEMKAHSEEDAEVAG